MLEPDIKKICDALAEKLRQSEMPKKPTGNIIIYVNTGAVSGKIRFELVL